MRAAAAVMIAVARVVDMGPRVALATILAGFDGPDDVGIAFTGGGVDGKPRILGAR